jgi:hypothetical protein
MEDAALVRQLPLTASPPFGALSFSADLREVDIVGQA